jgi:phospholipase/carboxylesterase
VRLKLPIQYIFQGAALEESRDLLVVLHGRGDSAAGLDWLQDELAIDTLNFLLLNAPRPYYTGFSWYDMPPHQLAGILASGKLLAQTFQEIAKAGFPPRRTFLGGFSQGCLMTLEFGSRYPVALAGYVGISGYCYDPAAILREMNPTVNRGNWLITHGTEDDLLPVTETRAQIQQLIAGGFQIDYREYRKEHTVDLKHEVPEIREWLLQRMSLEQ